MIVLASASPRRAELFHSLGVPFTVFALQVDEARIAAVCTGGPAVLAERLAAAKAQAAADRFPDAVAVGADTIVALGGEVFGKPRSEQDARRMLRALSGRTHSVYTGVAVRGPHGAVSDCVRADVTFLPLTDAQIGAYIATGEPFDKAGGYGVQGPAREFIRSIAGDYFCIVGLPMAKTAELLRAQGAL